MKINDLRVALSANMPAGPSMTDEHPPEDPPPLLSTWPRLYVGVLILELVVVAAIAVFSNWPWG
jgi:hypothetical protein